MREFTSLQKVLINSYFFSYPNVFGDFTGDWETAGKPRVWNIVATDDEADIVVFRDSGYGSIAVIQAGSIYSGRTHIALSNALIVDPTYFETTKWIWK